MVYLPKFAKFHGSRMNVTIRKICMKILLMKWFCGKKGDFHNKSIYLASTVIVTHLESCSYWNKLSSDTIRMGLWRLCARHLRIFHRKRYLLFTCQEGKEEDERGRNFNAGELKFSCWLEIGWNYIKTHLHTENKRESDLFDHGHRTTHCKSQVSFSHDIIVTCASTGVKATLDDRISRTLPRMQSHRLHSLIV